MLSTEAVVDGAASLIDPDDTHRGEIAARVWTDDCDLILPEMWLSGREASNHYITAV